MKNEVAAQRLDEAVFIISERYDVQQQFIFILVDGPIQPPASASDVESGSVN